ncbi:MAG: TIGR04211 family SH3 domain-containing protein [Desulfuromusa sp.]|jgi:SH3 domain protein|nr:TIGR04211 family SH3 domain-containing protein [Desulfuromusa sp.]
MKTSLHFIIFSLLFLFVTSSAYAETRYISDQLLVTVRSGKGNEYKVLETLPTSTPVTILEEDKPYVKVITPKGTEGYILSHYVSSALPKSVRIGQLNKEIDALQQQLAKQQQGFQTSQEEANTHKSKIAALSAQLDQTRQEQDKTKGEYKTLLSKSANVLNLSAENEQLIEESNLLNSELLVLREENQNFHRSNMIQWFLAGGAVFFGGWLIGKISRKKQRRF